MKNFFKILPLLLVLLFNAESFAQAKKPTIMIIPSKNWCVTNNFTSSIENQGKIEIVPDYEMALSKSFDLKLVIAKINGMMAERGFPLKDLEATLASSKSNAAEEMVTTSKTGSELSESAMDKLKRIAKADIIIEVSWEIQKKGPFKSVSFILRGLDAYTNKQIADGVGNGPENGSASVPVLLETAVLSQIDNFNAKLQNHFDDLFANGREVTIRVRKFDSWTGDLEKEYNNEELGTIIENWMKANTVKGRFNTTDATENQLLFEQVRIPIYDSNGNAIDARGFARNLQKFLNSPPYSITNKLMNNGLGQASIILGDK